MKLFLDSANLDEIREDDCWGVLRGITTYPTLMTKGTPRLPCPSQGDLLPVEGEVSIETASDSTEVLIQQAHDTRQIADNNTIVKSSSPTGIR
jgi:transaldolase